MAQPRTYQANFTGGELAPEMQSRSDVTKYQSGVRLARNFVLRPQGGLSFRTGFEFIAEVLDSTKQAWLIPVEIALTESYVLEFGENTLRFVRDGAYVVKQADRAAVLSVEGFAAAGALFGAPSHGFTGGERVLTDGFVDAPDVEGGYYEIVFVTVDSFRLRDRFGGLVTRPGMGAGTIGFATPVYQIATPYDAFRAKSLHYAQDQNELYLFHEEFQPHRLIRVGVDEWTLAAEDFGPSIAAPGAPSVGLPLTQSLLGDVSAADPAVVTTADTHGWADGDLVVFWNVAGSGGDLLGKRYEVANNTATAFNLRDPQSGVLIGRSTEAAVVDGRVGKVPDTSIEQRYAIAAIDDETGEESLPSPTRSIWNDLGILGQRNTLNWAAVAGASRYRVYKDDNGVLGFIGGTAGTTLTDENITADLSDTPQELRSPFDSAGNYPATGSFFEQRLWFGRTRNNPSGVWASQTARPRNLNVSSPVRADDAITFRVRGKRVSELQSFVPAENLIAFGSAAEWVIRGTRNDEGLKPTNVEPRTRTSRGSTTVLPLQVADLILHVQRGGNVVRDFSHLRDEPGSDLTVLARHLFEGRRVVSWTFAQTPDSIVWVVLDDGSLVSMTYMLEHEIWGWTRHSLGGGATAECVVTVAEGPVDAVYLLTRRTVNGVAKRYIERLFERAAASGENSVHADAALRFGAATEGGFVFGLDHMEGEAVAAVFGGFVVRDLVVQDGRVGVPFDVDEGFVGLPFTGRVETLDLDLGAVDEQGSVLGRQKSVVDVRLRVVETRGLFAGPLSTGELVEHKQRAAQVGSTEPKTGDIVFTPGPDWGETGAIIVEQRDPLPCYLAGLLIDWEFGE